MSLFLCYSAPVDRGTRTASACSFYPGGSSFLHRLCGGTRRAGGSPERAGCFSLNLSGWGVAAPRGGGQEGRHLRFLPSCAPAGQASSVHFASGKSREFSHEKSPFLFSQKCVHGHIRTIKSGKNFRWFYDAFRHEIDIQQGAQTSVLLCVQSVQGWDEKSNFCIEQSYTVHCDTTYSWL